MEKITEMTIPLLLAIVAQESAGNPKAENPTSHCKGLGQLADATGKEWKALLGWKVYDPFDVLQNLSITTAYMNWLLRQFKGDVELALAAYNWGIHNVKNKKIPGSVKQYVAEVLERYEHAKKFGPLVRGSHW